MLQHMPSAHCSGLGFSRELFSFFSVFLMRRAVRRAEGLWYQHSFMIFASADKIWGRHKKEGDMDGCHGMKWERDEGSPPGTHRVGEEAVGDHGGLLVNAHHLLHVLEAGVAGNGVEEGRPVLLHDAYGNGEQCEGTGGCEVHPLPPTSQGTMDLPRAMGYMWESQQPQPWCHTRPTRALLISA